MPEPVDRFLEQEINKNRILVIPILQDHVFRLLDLPLIHRDPFDRILLAQSIEDHLPIISNDRVLSRYPVEIIW